METIGFIGLGIMGAPMAGHLLDAGYNVIASDHRSKPTADLVAKGLKTVTGHAAVAKTADITAAALTATVTAASKAYDGTTGASATCTLAGVVSGETVTCTPSATFAGAAVGTGKSVTVALTLGGTHAGNYSVVSPVTRKNM